ncbi:penicillin-binding protein activator [Chitinispirillales bacterium ANBcel5]|uniref:penicillin-binding protein activator n=1 Tax=Cellulosispirillum alkaliphilum TaxID=3039283 RepID=UPI002A4EC8BE|nr:penicillin-binding protein activator [Chitinispirillales bacterium ANBcel5]
MLKKRTIAILIVFGALISSVANERSDVFNQAMEYYSAAQYDSTISLIREHLRRSGRDPENEYLVPLIVEAYVRSGEYGPVDRLVGMYQDRFPRSDFLPRIAYLDGVVKVRKEAYDRALEAFSGALGSGVNPELDSTIIATTKAICSEKMSARELSRVVSMGRLHPRILEIVRYNQIVKAIAAGQTERARSIKQEFSNRFPESDYLSKIAEDIPRLGVTVSEGEILMGMLAPLTGEDSDIGDQISKGVQLAIDQHNNRSRQKIRLLPYDTKGNMVETAHRSRDILRDQVPVVIGPVLSYNATVSASMFMDKDVVMLTPTASDDGIAGLGDNIFQMNITVGMLGREIARYAVENLNINEFAIIAPNNTYGAVISDHFKSELNRLGATVVHEEFFDVGIHDFTPHIMELRKTLIKRKLQEKARHQGNLTEITSVSRADSVKYADSTLSIGGLFMPVESEDVVMLAPQAVFHRLRTQMLGSSGWHSERTIKDGRRYVNDAIITTPFPINREDSGWQEFENSYRGKYNSEPGRLAALGYDAALIVSKIVEESGGDVQRIKRSLANVNRYQGLSGVITFDKNSGANLEAAVKKVGETGFLRVR